jgi:hypothetical protein
VVAASTFARADSALADGYYVVLDTGAESSPPSADDADKDSVRWLFDISGRDFAVNSSAGQLAAALVPGAAASKDWTTIGASTWTRRYRCALV